ncbi:hypothetical protein ACFFSH_31425 [Streptomyces filamentosus]|uniref:Uncharacterized protein n=1 Tax=Streptomyces filamentosus TaxID=67294 RepID=A0A919EQV7_STRFL|nr:hypothetical protein GCM10017667_53550 [Streptomyces filamentosus]
MYRMYGTAKGSPGDEDWELILETPDVVEATRSVHESEGTFWRRLTEDDQIVLDRV